MEKTPLELYETAYRLHYTENRISDAVAYYEKLLKSFPDSNECGYAVIQLQKIKATDIAKGLQQKPAATSPLVIMALLIALLALGAMLFLHWSSQKNALRESKRITLVTRALGKMYHGEDDDALKLLTELKILIKEDITPFELSADIYRKEKQFPAARGEYEMFFRLNPGRVPSEQEKNIMLHDERQSAGVSKKTNQVEEPAVEVPVVKYAPVVPPPPKNTRVANHPKKGTLRKPPPPPPKKPIKGLFLVDPDSISYF